jgi:hypothetical protein
MDDASCLNALDATLKYVAKGWPVFRIPPPAAAFSGLAE